MYGEGRGREGSSACVRVQEVVDGVRVPGIVKRQRARQSRGSKWAGR